MVQFSSRNIRGQTTRLHAESYQLRVLQAGTRREGRQNLVRAKAVQRMYTCGKAASCSRVGVLPDSATVMHPCPMHLMLQLMQPLVMKNSKSVEMTWRQKPNSW